MRATMLLSPASASAMSTPAALCWFIAVLLLAKPRASPVGRISAVQSADTPAVRWRMKLRLSAMPAETEASPKPPSPGLDPGVHVFPATIEAEDVDGRVKPGQGG